MKKLLGIIVLGLLLSGNAYAEIEAIKTSCVQTQSSSTYYNSLQYTIKPNEKKIHARLKWTSSKKIISYNGYLEIESWDGTNVIYTYSKQLPSHFKGKYKIDYSQDPYFEIDANTYKNNFQCRIVENVIAKKPKKKKPKTLPDDGKIVPAGSGSGFFVSRDGHIITNHHVIEGCNTTKVTFKGNQLDAKILSVDKTNDIAILKVNINTNDIFPVSNEDVSLLEDVVVAGYPLGKKVSSAIKTHKGVVTALAGAGDNYSNFQTDATINAGNSGGPIMNQKGNIVGIAVATWVEKGVQGVHFGIKSSTLKTFASSNSLKFSQPNNRELSNKDLGKLITEATVYLECHMTVANIKKMISAANNRKAFFSEFK